MPVNGLVFSGGGLRGFAFIGALKALETTPDIDLSNIEYLAGCSVGAIMASSIAVGYVADELYDFILHFDYDTIKELNILGFFERFGIETGNKILEFFRILLKKKTGYENTTFKELYDLRKKHLVINATCINTHQIEYFDYVQSPNMPIALAIRMSISLPFIITPVSYNGKLYVDDGAVDNFPIPLHKNPNEILGFRLSNSRQKINNIDSFITFAQHTWSSVYGEMTRLKLHLIKDYPYVTIMTKGIHTFNLHLTKKERIYLFNQGFKTTKKFLKDYNKHPVNNTGLIRLDTVTPLFKDQIFCDNDTI